MILLAATLAFTAAAQDWNSIYNRYSGKEGVSSVYISPAMFRLMKSLPDVEIESEDVDLGGIIRTFTGMYILDIEDGKAAAELEAELQHVIKAGRYELLMEAADESETMRIYTISKGDTVTDFLMLAYDGSETSVIAITGEIPFSELQKLISE